MFSFIAMLGALTLGGSGPQLALYIGLIGGTAGGVYLKKDAKRAAMLGLNVYWDDFRAVAQMKKELRKEELSEEETEQAKVKYGEGFVSWSVLPSMMPPLMQEYVGEYLLTKQEYFRLLFDMDRRFELDRRAALLGFNDGSKALFDLFTKAKIKVPEVMTNSDTENVAKGWDKVFVLEELKEISRLRLADARLVAEIDAAKLAA